MALYYSAPNCICSSSPPTPAKTLISNSNSLILRTPCIILHPFSPKTSIATKPFKLNFPLRAQRPPHKYTYPDPIPEFAQAETQKFRDDLLEKLLGDKETFGDDLDTVIDVCTQIFSDFLHKEYGGPGTLLIEPFTDMFVALKERKLPGAPVAARASLLWAQNYVDHDWEVWNSNLPK